MASKKQKLIQRAQETVRHPRPRKVLEPEKKGYRVVAVSLYTPEATWIDATVAKIKEGGHPKANRSLVVREAILRLQEVIQGMTPAELVNDLAHHDRKRKEGNL